MQEYIQELQQKVGLTAEQAKNAIEAIVAKVKSKVPESLHGSIDGLFSGSATDAAGGFQGKASSFADKAEEKIKGFAAEARESLSDLAGKAEDLAEDVKEKTESMVKDLGDKLSGTFGKQPPPKP